MAELIKLIKESIDLSVRMRWLKEMNRALDKRHKIYQDYIRQGLVIDDLVNEFNERYPDNKIKLAWKGK